MSLETVSRPYKLHSRNVRRGLSPWQSRCIPSISFLRLPSRCPKFPRGISCNQLFTFNAAACRFQPKVVSYKVFLSRKIIPSSNLHSCFPFYTCSEGRIPRVDLSVVHIQGDKNGRLRSIDRRVSSFNIFLFMSPLDLWAEQWREMFIDGDAFR